jgi:hypothetical protein
MSGLASVDAMSAKLKAMGNPERVASRVAEVAAPLVDAAIKRTAAAGTTPDGNPWAPTKDGKRPLENVVSQITTSAAGPTITTTLTGPAAFHSKGLGHSPRRQVLPDTGNVPPAVEDALNQAAKQVFEEMTR